VCHTCCVLQTLSLSLDVELQSCDDDQRLSTDGAVALATSWSARNVDGAVPLTSLPDVTETAGVTELVVPPHSLLEVSAT